eukprot:Hpha_TRINITY_DN14678_c0_g2::TRINITY_DN14678_c0_g2_i1::g.48580::m.48580
MSAPGIKHYSHLFLYLGRWGANQTYHPGINGAWPGVNKKRKKTRRGKKGGDKITMSRDSGVIFNIYSTGSPQRGWRGGEHAGRSSVSLTPSLSEVTRVAHCVYASEGVLTVRDMIESHHNHDICSNERCPPEVVGTASFEQLGEDEDRREDGEEIKRRIQQHEPVARVFLAHSHGHVDQNRDLHEHHLDTSHVADFDREVEHVRPRELNRIRKLGKARDQGDDGQPCEFLRDAVVVQSGLQCVEEDFAHKGKQHRAHHHNGGTHPNRPRRSLVPPVPPSLGRLGPRLRLFADPPSALSTRGRLAEDWGLWKLHLTGLGRRRRFLYVLGLRGVKVRVRVNFLVRLEREEQPNQVQRNQASAHRVHKRLHMVGVHTVPRVVMLRVVATSALQLGELELPVAPVVETVEVPRRSACQVTITDLTALAPELVIAVNVVVNRRDHNTDSAHGEHRAAHTVGTSVVVQVIVPYPAQQHRKARQQQDAREYPASGGGGHQTVEALLQREVVEDELSQRAERRVQHSSHHVMRLRRYRGH